ncbi:hypothetical protein OUZ56_021876 [Daphnia magna]|uniref:Uncharacterized protein n=1 Tax=Daphnia magna TaxID=35525 RepID=A0ABR0AUP5_9CRUS|nr:hypothetical protein OUZ56_021876 [Daphnia magna]
MTSVEHPNSKSDVGLSAGYKKDVLNIRPRHLSDIRWTALCYVGGASQINSPFNASITEIPHQFSWKMQRWETLL